MLDWRPDEEAFGVRSVDDVQKVLVAKGIPHEIVHLTSSSSTAQRAADALGVPVETVVKSLLFVLDEMRPVLALITGDATVWMLRRWRVRLARRPFGWPAAERYEM